MFSSLCNNIVFSGAFENSDCKGILINVLKKLDIQVKQIFQLSQKKKESQIKGKGQLADLTKSLNFINEKFNKYEKDRKGRDQEIKKSKGHILEMSYDMKSLGEKVDRHEQYSRRYCLLIYSVKEDVKEDTDKLAIQLIRDDLEVDVDIDDLGRTHRIGSSRNSNDRARPIIVKFTRYNARKKVFIDKKNFKAKISVSLNV